MGLVVDQSAPPPPTPTQAASPDGMLTVTTDFAWAGARIVIDASAQVPQPTVVRVYRRDTDGSVHTVRGADRNLAPGGISPAYDHEAPLGDTSTWWAVAVDPRTGQETPLTGEAVLALPEPPAGPGDFWIKSITDPAASLRAFVTSAPDEAYTSRTTTTEVIGRAHPVARLGTRSAATTTMTVATTTPSGRAGMERLLGITGPETVLLVQTRREYHRPDRYYVSGDVECTQGERPAYQPVWLWTVPLTAVRRPPTTGSVMRTPGASYAGLPYNTWPEAGAVNPIYLDLMDG